MNVKPELIKLFEESFGVLLEIKLIAGGGSPRKYYRLTGERITVVGVYGEDIKENETFVNLDNCLAEQGIPVPHVIKVSSDLKSYLIEDLGDTSLLNLLGGDKKITLAKKALDELINLQTLPESLWMDKVGFPPFSQRLVKWDLNYFKYDFLKPYGIAFDEEKLEDDFELLSKRLTKESMIQGFMYRDFQSRNIMVKDDKLWFIDFQGARKGPLAYDAVSFIWQAKAPFTYDEREALGKYYIRRLSGLGYSADDLESQMEILQLFRALQVLGAYGFRGLIEKKSHFIESLPLGISNLVYLKGKGCLKDFPELLKITDGLEEKQTYGCNSSDGKLVITVYSFSYKKGYPEDLSGNGGGFMFDCRAIHNPGRYEEYKNSTGRDTSVIEFLEKTDEASEFVVNALELVKPSVQRYLKRGFTSLQIGFGCTGGQHRSVYCADRFAEAIKKLYPETVVKIIHREQGIKECL